jgi:acyl-CoA thioester hydrolase
VPVTFEFPIRVYYEDTDAAGVVYYANFLKFFERARTEWLRSVGVSQQRLAREMGVVFVVTRTAVDYLAPARLDDRVVVRSRLARLGRASVEFHQEAWCLGETNPPGEDELLARGDIKVGCVNRETLRPEKIPASILSAFQP